MDLRELLCNCFEGEIHASARRLLRTLTRCEADPRCVGNLMSDRAKFDLRGNSVAFVLRHSGRICRWRVFSTAIRVTVVGPRG